LAGWWPAAPGAAAAAARAVGEAIRLACERAKDEGDRADRLSRILTFWPLPKVADVPIYGRIGVFDSAIARGFVPEGVDPPYVARVIDPQLRSELQRKTFVL